MSLPILPTIKRDVWKGVVTQGYVLRHLVSLISLTEHLLSEHFAKEQSPVVIASHIVIYLPGRQKVNPKQSLKKMIKYMSCFGMESCLIAHRVVKYWGGFPGVVPLWQSDHQDVLHEFTGCCVGIVSRAGGRERVSQCQMFLLTNSNVAFPV